MPISAERMKLYPGGSIRSREWRDLRTTIMERSSYRCEGTDMHPDCRALNNADHPETGSMVVLTVAHMDHNPLNNDHGNLRALCQRCHLKWDAKHHAANAAKTRRAKSAQIDMEGL